MNEGRLVLFKVPDGRSIRARLGPAMTAGTQLRLKGLGQDGSDLYLRVQIS